MQLLNDEDNECDFKISKWLKTCVQRIKIESTVKTGVHSLLVWNTHFNPLGWTDFTHFTCIPVDQKDRTTWLPVFKN